MGELDAKVVNKRFIMLNGRKFQTAPGNYTSSIVLYAGVCVFYSCNSHYTGKTTQPMNERINGHHSNFKKYCEKSLYPEGILSSIVHMVYPCLCDLFHLF